MSRIHRALLAAVEYCAPAGLGANLAGDLEEEAREFGEWWLARECVRASWHGMKMRSERWNLLETAAATALLFAAPLTLLLALRRFALVLIPYRESAELGGAGLAGLCGVIALLAAGQSALLGSAPVRRIALLGTIAAAALPILFAIPMTPGQRCALMAAVWIGGCAPRCFRKGRS